MPSGLQELFSSDLIRRQLCKKILTLPTKYHSAEIGNHDCFYNADHVYEIQGILLGSDGW